MIHVLVALVLILRPEAAELLRQLSQRQPAPALVASRSEGAERIAAELRARFEQHPKQRAFWQSQSECKRDAALCTRRAGKSDGGVHEWLAKAITIPGWRGVYVNETKPEARKIVWRNDMGQGWVDLIARHGRVEGNGYLLGNVLATPNDTTLELNFSNGSQIALFGADDEASINKLRGQTKDEIWIDEAQKMRHLRAFILQVASACVKDKRGRIKLTGTPCEDASGYFYDVTPEPESGDEPLSGWAVFRWSVTDNPWFGATAEERWDRTAGEALAENGWDGTEPEFVREWLGRWVKSDARYVYPVHAAPPHIALEYAPQRLTANPINARHPQWIDVHAALADLPRRTGRKAYTWLYAIGADFGYAQDPFAIVVWAMTYDLPEIYELFSWKEHKVIPDDQRDYLRFLFDALDNVIVLVGDPAGQVSANMAGWRERTMLPIDEAEKSSKPTWQALMAGDIRKGRVRYRAGSPLLVEHKHLVYLPTKPGKPLKDHADRRSSDGKVHGNHCLVAGTMVATAYGDRPIECIVPGDRVWTRAGLRTVTSATPTRVAPTYDLILDDGRVLRGTGDHPIATLHGWIELQNLTPGDMVYGWASTDWPRLEFSVAGDTEDIQRRHIGPRVSTFSERLSETDEPSLNCYIGLSGSPSAGSFRMASTSITRTRTQETTISRISSAGQDPITYESMPRHLNALLHHAGTSLSPWMLHERGMVPTRGAHGTGSMGHELWRLERSFRSDASSAAANSRARVRKPSCAVTSAEPQHDATAESTIPIVHASNAELCSGLTVIANRPVALIRVRRVDPTGCVEQTYDISVEGEHEFVANGIVVSNCSDAGLYSYRHLTHYMHKPVEERPPPGTREAYVAEAEREQKQIEDAETRRSREMMERDELAMEYDKYEW